MRTIKFRGKTSKFNEFLEKQETQWVYGYYYYSSISLDHNIINENDEIIEIIPLTIGQFTGLTDKNGKDIYEGDIVRWDDNSNGGYWRVCAISWENSHYKLTGYTFSTGLEDIKKPVDFKFGQFIYEYDGVLEIIGNIHDNPELL